MSYIRNARIAVPMAKVQKCKSASVNSAVALHALRLRVQRAHRHPALPQTSEHIFVPAGPAKAGTDRGNE